MSESDAVLAKLKKELGPQIGNLGVTKTEAPRIPTGIFPLDLAMGGGFPRARLSIVFGPESSTKTTLMYRLISHVQKVMGSRAVLVDAEHSLDADWAHHNGVDLTKLVHVEPDTAEQVVDVTEAMLGAADVDLVIVDSLASMTPDNEIIKGAEVQAVGGNSLLVGKLVRKSVAAISREQRREHNPALICLNQIRHKIGVMHGNPEYMPGGNAPRFASSMTLRLYAKDEFVEAIHPGIPTFKLVTGTIKKWRVPILSTSFEYRLCLIPHKHLKVGDVDSWNTVSNRLKKMGVLQSEKGKWTVEGDAEVYDTLHKIQAKFHSDPKYRLNLEQRVTAYEMENVGQPIEQPSVDPETGEITE